MKSIGWVIATAAMLLGLVVGGLIWGTQVALAQSLPRTTAVTVPFTEYEWWLIAWSSNEIACRVLIDHEGLPSVSEVSHSCGADYATAWWNTPNCKQNGKPCQGFYLYFVASLQKERQITVTLPSPTMAIALEGCNPAPPDNFCPQIPALMLTAEEPLPNQQIVSIQGVFDGQPFECAGSQCSLPMYTTPVQGVGVEFWANSSYGDASEHFTAQVRILETGVSRVPDGLNDGYYVDIISSQWSGPALTSCSRIWEAFPPVGQTPDWLTTPDHFEVMASGDPYYYLAGRLLSQGVVDAPACPNKGLLPNGYADACGLETARPIVEDWQNQFDQRIIQVSSDTGVPAQLMKNLFAQESQFWPGMYRVAYEFGLGQITDQGADPIFIWNPEFYGQFCPLILSSEACSHGYLMLDEKDRSILRGALALQARADCADCPAGIDISNVGFTVSLFANTLKANCAQVSRVVFNASGEMAGRVATYEDLWRFTIANYHVGPGCVSFAIHQAWQTGGTLTWDVVSTRFTEPCQGVVPYVNQITQFTAPPPTVEEAAQP